MAIVTSGLQLYLNSQNGVNGTTWQNIAPGSGSSAYNGTLIGPVSVQSGGMTYATGGCVAIPILPNLHNARSSFTIEFRANISNSSTSPDFLVTGSAAGVPSKYEFYVSNNSGSYTDLHVTLYDSSSTGHSNYYSMLADNQEIYYSITYDMTSTKMYIYKNGAQVTSFSYTSTTDYFVDDTSLDVSHILLSDTKTGLVGIMDNVRIYNRALTATEVSQNYSNGTAIGLTPATPSVPTNTSPADGASLSQLRPTFSGVVSQPDSYNVQLDIDISMDSTFATGVTSFSSGLTTSGSTASVIIPSPLSSGTWYWRARTTDQFGDHSAYTATNTLTIINNPPALPTSLYPADGASISSTLEFDATVTDPDNNPVALVVDVASDSAFTSPTTFQSSYAASGDTATIKPTGIGLGTWYWRARSYDSQYYSSYTATRSFTLTNIPPTVSNFSPASQTRITTLSTNLSAQVDDANGDNVTALFEVTQDSSFASGVTVISSASTAPGTVITMSTGNLSNGVWYWRVRARDAQGAYSDYSNGFVLYVESSTTTHVAINGTGSGGISGMSGAWTNISDSPDSPDTLSVTQSMATGTADLTLAQPSGKGLITGAGLQTFRVNAVSTNSALNPTMKVDVYQSGTLKVSTTTQTVTNTTTIYSFTWDASVLSTLDGTGVECYITCTQAKSGGKTSNVQLNAVDWVATVRYDAGTVSDPTPVTILQGASQFSGVGSLSATATGGSSNTLVSGAVALAGTGSTSMSPAAIYADILSVIGSGSTALSGAMIYSDSMNISGLGSTTNNGVDITPMGAMTLTAMGSANMSGASMTISSISVSGVGSSNMSGVDILSDSVPISGTSASSNTGSGILGGIVSLDGVGVANYTGSRLTSDGTSMSGGGAFSTNGVYLVTDGLSLNALGGFNPSGVAIKTDGATISGTGLSTTTGIKVVSGGSGINGIGVLSSSAIRLLTNMLPMSAIGAMSATGTNTILGTLPLTTLASLSAVGTRITSNSVSTQGTGSTSSTGVRTLSDSLATSGIGSTNSSGVSIKSDSITISGTGSMTATALRVMVDILQSVATSSVSFNGTLLVSGSTGMSGTGIDTFSVASDILGLTNMSGSGSTSVSGVRMLSDSSNMSGATSETASGVRMLSDSSAVHGTTSETASGVDRKTGNVTSVGAGVLNSGGIRYLSDLLHIIASGNMSLSAVNVMTNSTALSALGSLVADGITSIMGNITVLMRGVGSLGATGSKISKGTISTSGVSSMSSHATHLMSALVSIGASGLLTPLGVRRTSDSSSLSGSGSVTPKGVRVARDTLGISGISSSSSTGKLTVGGKAILNGVGALSAHAMRTMVDRMTISGIGEVSAHTANIFMGQLAMQGAGSVGTHAVKMIQSNASSNGMGSISPEAIRELILKAVMNATSNASVPSTLVVRGAQVDISADSTMESLGSLIQSGILDLSGATSMTSDVYITMFNGATIQGVSDAIFVGTVKEAPGIDLQASIESIGIAGSTPPDTQLGGITDTVQIIGLLDSSKNLVGVAILSVQLRGEVDNG